MNEPKEFTVEISDQVKAEMDADPELGAALREFFANCHQAHDAVAAGRHPTFEAAIEAITGHKLKKIEIDDE
ncbi:hypothetical protein AB6806_27390 [Bosea sp. RCC_152_1]|uniref:hypothetical protein n=1 Tax=Bosea sp. RCC_152_1 TaxID=3239228 RepID=UPI00352604AC